MSSLAPAGSDGVRRIKVSLAGIGAIPVVACAHLENAISVFTRRPTADVSLSAMPSPMIPLPIPIGLPVQIRRRERTGTSRQQAILTGQCSDWPRLTPQGERGASFNRQLAQPLRGRGRRAGVPPHRHHFIDNIDEIERLLGRFRRRSTRSSA